MITPLENFRRVWRSWVCEVARAAPVGVLSLLVQGTVHRDRPPEAPALGVDPHQKKSLRKYRKKKLDCLPPLARKATAGKGICERTVVRSNSGGNGGKARMRKSWGERGKPVINQYALPRLRI